jgi:inorganic triphosphatase YgiF
MPREVELKLEVAPARLTALKKIAALRNLRGKHSAEVSVYFDTKNHKLRRKGLLLRVRRIGRRHIQTIKAAHSAVPFERDEWEAEITSDGPDLSRAAGTALEPMLDNKLRRKLRPLFETCVQRTVYPIADDTRAISLTIDKGTISTGSRSAPLCEIELELKRGEMVHLFDVARELTRVLEAQLAVKSKSERGYELIDGEEDAPVKAVPVNIPPKATSREAFKIIGRACLKQIAGNEHALNKGDPEGVHEMRVGLRRLRAAMSLFSDLLGDPQTAAVKAEVKWLTRQLGPARELEVLVKRVITPIKSQRTHWRGVGSLSQEFSERREAAVMRAQRAVKSARFRALTFEIARWLEAGKWTTPHDDLVRDRGNLPITVSAAGELSSRWRRMRKKGRTLAELGASDRHKLRIQAKKLRYAVDFFSSLFKNKRSVARRNRFLRELERLQDGLGDLNDIAVHEDRIAAASVRRGQPNPSRAFAGGLLTGREDARMPTAMATTIAALANLAESKPFWR